MKTFFFAKMAVDEVAALLLLILENANEWEDFIVDKDMEMIAIAVEALIVLGEVLKSEGVVDIGGVLLTTWHGFRTYVLSFLE
mmetsp:Transcript_7685/g.10475  ORF Transcript_7685/g.10475 Transcript_7685/m.10475 type:complete len:83 (+) Transcript_7685:1039-1287(+)